MNAGPVSLGDVGARLTALEKEHNKVLSRLTALQLVVNSLCWGIGRERTEVADRILASGAASLPHINKIGGDAPSEVARVWNSAVNEIINPSPQPPVIGDSSQRG